ncbi:hypothetical protein GCM10009765_39160 [Fodinicola feengrottensis]|uniref:Integral membrane protein n=1 Tax=Fodinicola feengrottensis TaxID=435914 RepID=A0ABN2HDT8_9ACTN
MPETRERRATRSGFGRVLVAVYGIFALSASARAGVQIATKFSEAPLAFSLSALAAVIYIVATVSLALDGDVWRRLAFAACGTEFVGVLVIGTYSLLDRVAFPEATVWSDYGQGYGYVPAVLPLVGLFWLYYTRMRVRNVKS